MQKDIHPKIRTFVKVFYNNNYSKFSKEYSDLLGSDIDLSKPSAGIVKFIREKWGLSSDVLLGLDKVAYSIKNRKFKSLKRTSNAYAFASALFRFLNILIDENLLNANELDFRSRILDPKEDAERFIDFYGLNKSSINDFKYIKALLEEIDIYVFAFPLDTNFQEGVVYPSSPSFIILNSKIKACKSGFALAHEIGHYLYMDIQNEPIEESLANKFATYLVIPTPILPYIKEVFESSLRHNNKEFQFIKEICKIFNCKIHPLTAIERLFLEDFLSKDEKDDWKRKISMIENRINKRNSNSQWEKDFSKEIGVILSEKYKIAIKKLLSEKKISEKRAKELLFGNLKDV